MTSRTSAQRRHLSALAVLAMLSIGWPISAHAQSVLPTLVLRPHCEAIDQTLCPPFDVADPSTLQTPPLSTGDTLDLDVVLENPLQEKIGKFRLWISYDVEALEGTVLSVSPAFPIVAPGQADFSPLSGYAKIAAGAATGSEPADAILPIARLMFTVKNSANAPSTPLSFYDQRAGTDGHTVITTVTAPTQNVLSAPLGALLVQLVPSPTAAQESSAAAIASTDDNSASDVSSASSTSPALRSSPQVSEGGPAPESPNTFGLIQIQNVRVGTKESSLYVTWDALSTPKLQGYNVYYGTLQGRYLNRRSVSVASRGAMIRDLPTGKTYYVAVRGVDDGNQETAFSAEASVDIGNPSTSSSPIVGTLDLVADVAPSTSAPENPVGQMRETAVPGTSGAPSGFVLLLLGSAAIGTLLACRRQMTASRRLPV